MNDNIGFFQGDKNIVGKDIVISGSINLNNDSIPSDVNPIFQRAILDFSSKLNEKIKNIQIPMDDNDILNRNINQLIEDVRNIKPESQIGIIKQSDIKNKIFGIVRIVLKFLSKSETLALIEPLEPYGKLIGGISAIAKAITDEL